MPRLTRSLVRETQVQGGLRLEMAEYLDTLSERLEMFLANGLAGLKSREWLIECLGFKPSAVARWTFHESCGRLAA
jgi:hypothetical protein